MKEKKKSHVDGGEVVIFNHSSMIAKRSLAPGGWLEKTVQLRSQCPSVGLWRGPHATLGYTVWR